MRVRVWGTESGPGQAIEAADWSPAATVEAGLLAPSDWVAVPVAADWDEEPESDTRRPPLLRRDFTVGADLVSARLYATAHGLYEAEINGRRVGDDALVAGLDRLRERLRYYTLRRDRAPAPRRQRDRLLARRRLVPGPPGLARRLPQPVRLRPVAHRPARTHATTDGRVETIATDEHWRASFGPIMRTGNYDGEDYDAREELPGWSEPGFDDSGWTACGSAHATPPRSSRRRAPRCAARRRSRRSRSSRRPSGRRILDFGQNLVGRLRIRVTGPAGQTVICAPPRCMQDGEIYTRPLREAQVDRQLHARRPRGRRGVGAAVHVPRLPLRGDHRMAGRPRRGGRERRHRRAGLPHRPRAHGWFECSDAAREPPARERRVEHARQLRRHPHRLPAARRARGLDRRHPGLRTARRRSSTTCRACSAAGCRTSRSSSCPTAPCPGTCRSSPRTHMWTPIRPGAVWGDVAVLTPWVLYERFGDMGVLAAQYDSAQARGSICVDRLSRPRPPVERGLPARRLARPGRSPAGSGRARTDRYLVATAYFAWSHGAPREDRRRARSRRRRRALRRARRRRRDAAFARRVRAATTG